MEGICNLDTSVVKGCRLIRAQFGIKIDVFPPAKKKKKKNVIIHRSKCKGNSRKWEEKLKVHYVVLGCVCLPWVFHSGRSVPPPGGLCAFQPVCTVSRWAGHQWHSTCSPSPRRAPGTGALWGGSPAWARWAGGLWTASCWGESPGGTPRSTTPHMSRKSWRRPAAGPARRTGTGPAREAYLGWTWRRWRGPAPIGCSLPRRESWARCGAWAAAGGEAALLKMRPAELCR